MIQVSNLTLMKIQRRRWRKWRSHCWSQSQYQEVDIGEGEHPPVSASSETSLAEYMCCY